MFGNVVFSPNETSRRHSHIDVSISPKSFHRRVTMPIIDVTGMSPGLGTMMGGYHTDQPSPCFMTPNLGGFTGRRFSFDSPLQTISTLSSSGLPTLNKKAAKRTWAKMSTKKWSRPCKLIAILLLGSFALTLLFVRKVTEGSVSVPLSCNEEDGVCDASEVHYHENNPKEDFMELVSQTNYHTLEEPSDVWANRWSEPDEEILDGQTLDSLDKPNESEVHVQELLELENLSEMPNYEESEKLTGYKISRNESKDGVVEFVSTEEDVSTSMKKSPSESINLIQAQIKPELQAQSGSIHLQVPTNINPLHDVHKVDSITDTHTVLEPEMWPMQRHTQMNQMQVNGGLEHSKAGPIHQPAIPQPPAGYVLVPRSDYPSHMGDMSAQLSGYLSPHERYGVPPPPVIPQQHLVQLSPGMMPNPGHEVAQDINYVYYNQPYPQHQFHNEHRHIIHKEPQQNWHLNGQRLPPGVNPHRYMGL